MVKKIGMVHAYEQSRSRKEATLVFNHDDFTLFIVRLHR